MLPTTGKKTWEGFDDGGQLSPFGVTHEANRLALKQSKSGTGNNSFQHPPAKGTYGIGTVRKGGKQSKSSKKGSSKKRKSSKKSSKKASSKASSKGPATTPGPPTGGGCRVSVNVDFLQFSAIPPALFNDPSNPEEQDPGTRYVYNDSLRDQITLDELQGSGGSGTCTRTESRAGNDVIGLQLGRGYCQFTYTLFDGNKEITFTAAGEVVDSLGGILSITGGTSSVIGAYGEIEIIPVNLNPDGSFEVETGDFFLGPLFYLADASIFVPCS
jgi:hypothetical protein